MDGRWWHYRYMNADTFWRVFAEEIGPASIFEFSPATADIADARQWLEMTGAVLDGVVAKRSDLSDQTGARTGMQKIKKLRTTDVSWVDSATRRSRK